MIQPIRNIKKANTFFLVNAIDPTKTLTTRNKFVAEVRRRFRQLMADIREAVVDLDVLGLSEESRVTNISNAANLVPRQFDFTRSDRKVEAFVKWLEKQNEQYLLSSGKSGLGIVAGQISGDGTDARNSWMSTYIDSSYQQGIRRARQEIRKAGIKIDEGQDGGDPIRVAFNQPIHADRVGLIYTRAFSSLKGITNEMESVVSDVLAMGLAEGKGPREIAKLLDKAILGKGGSLEITDRLGRKIPSLRRAEILARTEVIRSHHSANIGEYKRAGLMGIQIQAEHVTAGDSRVCPICKPLNGKIYTLEEAEHVIPVHPQCRCVAVPFIPEDN